MQSTTRSPASARRRSRCRRPPKRCGALSARPGPIEPRRRRAHGGFPRENSSRIEALNFALGRVGSGLRSASSRAHRRNRGDRDAWPLLPSFRLPIPPRPCCIKSYPFWVVQTEHLGLIVVSKGFRVATPIDYGIECFLGGGVAQMVLQLLLEPYPRRPVARAFVEHALDVLGQRYGGEEVVGENFLAGLRVELGKIACRRTQHNIALLDLGEAEVMENFGDWEQLVDFQLQIACEFRQVRLAMVRRSGDGLDQTGNRVGRDGCQSAAELQLRQMLGSPEGWAGRHVGINIVDHLAKGFVQAVAGMRKGDFDFARDASG